MTGSEKRDHFREKLKWRYSQLKFGNWRKQLFLIFCFYLQVVLGPFLYLHADLKPGNAVKVPKRPRKDSSLKILFTLHV